jgi:SAM-dependent methyltransferase
MSSNEQRRVISPELAIEANIHVHSQLARTGEYARSPHFRPENRRHVRALLQKLVCGYGGGRPWRAIDFGCGTGFLIDLMHDLVDEIDGVDITPEMMRQVDLSPGNIRLHEARAEATPFRDCEYDFATSYSFMDHLYDYRPFIKEAARVLKPGGVFFSDLNPNRLFIDAVAVADGRFGDGLQSFPVVSKEVDGAIRNGQHYERSVGVDACMLEAAEPIKTLSRGFDASEVLTFAKSCGFTDVRVEYEWFLGQGVVVNGEHPEDVQTIRRYLEMIEPVSMHLFKYLRFIFVK